MEKDLSPFFEYPEISFQEFTDLISPFLNPKKLLIAFLTILQANPTDETLKVN